MGPDRNPVEPGQESVWDFPRPARAEPTSLRIVIHFGGRIIVDTTRAFRVIETSHPPSYYVPPDDIAPECLRPNPATSMCEWKGAASYFDVIVGNAIARQAAWTYKRPTPAFAPMANHVAFYPGQMEACFVDGERVTPQAGGFYGGWITRHVAGPFKGGPGSMGW